MRRSHGLTWECRAPSHRPAIFTDEIEYQKHARDEHGVPEAHVRQVSATARRSSKDKIYECPFGDSFLPSGEADHYGMFSSKELYSHVTAHLKEIALLVLQKLPTDGETEASDLASDMPFPDDGSAKLRGSMCSIMADDRLKVSDAAEDDQVGD